MLLVSQWYVVNTSGQQSDQKWRSSPKNATKYGYFLADLQKFWAMFRQIAEVWAIALPKIMILAFFGTFWLLLWRQSGSSGGQYLSLQLADKSKLSIFI